MESAKQKQTIVTGILRFFFALSLLISCGGERPLGLAPTHSQGGPKVIWDINAKPLPAVPLPNDTATVLDPTSPTGRRLNVSLRADTVFEQRMRAGFNKLDGFGTYGGIFVRFDAPLDLQDLWARHNGGPWPEGGEFRDDFRDDAVFLLNVDPSCSRYGEEIALDIGRGRFPVVLDKHAQKIEDELAPGGYRIGGGNIAFDFDPQAFSNNIFFEERDEDVNGNGILEEEEDTDFDGHLDKPNLMVMDACSELEPQSIAYDRCIADNILTFYDREDNTLILRPVWPLESRCAHAVVLTRRLKGEDGEAVRSPFEGINPVAHTEALKALPELMSRYELGLEDIAFTWKFTTGSMTEDLEALRAGLYGHGTFKHLKDEFPVEDTRIFKPAGDNSTDTLFPGACAGLSLNRVWEDIIGEWRPNLCALDSDFNAIGGVFMGWFKAPNLIVDQDGIANEFYAADSDESWVIDSSKGEADYGTSEVPFWCFLPREDPTVECAEGNPEGLPFCKPYPVILYAHGYTGSRAGIQDFAGRANAMGYAACAMDAYGHGGNRERMAFPPGFLFINFSDFGAADMEELMLAGRDRDLNNDGLPDPGGDFWTSDLFHTRDMLRQTVLEWIQFVRILRSFDGIRTDSDGRLLGDPDGDGVIDLGGPKTTLGMWGISLGGIVSGIMKGAEPSLNAVSPNAGGAGLTDIAVRSNQAGVPEAVLLPIIGPLVLGALEVDGHDNPVEGAQLSLYYLLNDAGQDRNRTFATIDGVQAGDKVLLENLDKKKSAWTRVSPYGNFRVSVAADALGPIERRGLLGLVDDELGPVPFADTAALGDRIRLTFYEGTSETVRTVLDSFQKDVEFQGTIYPEGSPLVVLQEGLGYRRNTPDFRRFLQIAQHALDPADPAIWSARVAENPINVDYDPNRTEAWGKGHTRVLYMPTVGDTQVPVNTGVAEGRIGGILGSWARDEDRDPRYGWRALFEPDERYGHSADQELIESYVVEGVERLRRFEDSHPELPHQAVLFDIENVSDGLAEWSCQKGSGDWANFNCPEGLQGTDFYFPVPHAKGDKALRAQRDRGDGRFDAMRVPLIRPIGQHGIYNAQPFRVFDADAYLVNYTLRFLGTGGAKADHVEGCDCSASGLAQWRLNDASVNGVQYLEEGCTEVDLKICSPECLAIWGFKELTEPSVCLY